MGCGVRSMVRRLGAALSTGSTGGAGDGCGGGGMGGGARSMVRVLTVVSFGASISFLRSSSALPRAPSPFSLHACCNSLYDIASSEVFGASAAMGAWRVAKKYDDAGGSTASGRIALDQRAVA